MEVIEFLKERGIQSLVDEYAILVKEYDDRYVLNYNQIESPKAAEIVKECRGLILDKQFNVISRSFDRFFNYGEGECPDIDVSQCVVWDKADGSLIKVYHHNGNWEISTRGTAFAESQVNGWDLTFRDLVLRALNLDEHGFQQVCGRYLHPDVTYIFELCCPENRVVKRYDGDKLFFLAARTKDGEYVDVEEGLDVFNLSCIEKHNLSTIEECLTASKNLTNLDEGFVLYKDGVPVCKIKSPTYLAVHRIRGEGLSPKRIKQLVLMAEQDEYLAYFPEDSEYFTPYVDAFDKLMLQIVKVWGNVKDIEDQKEFALTVKDFPYSSCLFQARSKGLNPLHTFNEQRENYKISVLDKFMEGL